MNKKLFPGLVLSAALFLSIGCATTGERAFKEDPYWVGGVMNTTEATESHSSWIPFIETPGSNQSKLPDERSPALDGSSNTREPSGGYETSPFARKRDFYATVPTGVH